MINSEQIIICISLINVPLPASTLDFLKEIYSIASFDLIPNLGDMINSILGLLPTEPITQGLADLGFESDYIINNLGTIFFFFLSYPFAILLQLALQRCEKSSERVARANQYLKRSLYYNSFITGLNEGYSVLALSVLIGLYNLNWDTPGTSIQSFFCLFFGVMIIVVPARLFWVTLFDFAELTEEEIEERYGSIYSGLRQKSGKAVLMQPAFFLVRRLIVAIAIVFFRETLIAQIYLIWA